MILPHRVQSVVQSICALLLLVLLNGCAVGYYWQAGMGQLRITNGQQPVAEVLQDPQLAPAVRDRLEVSQQALAFAHATLRLPDNGSYTAYYDTGAPYVVWNVFAAPELSLEPRTWCFPIAGCIAYRGYFRESNARRWRYYRLLDAGSVAGSCAEHDAATAGTGFHRADISRARASATVRSG
jgi:predicted aminopeptidase